MSERRLATRFQVHLPVNYQSETVTMPGLVSSISRTGLFVRSDFLDSNGQKVALDLRLPGDVEPVKLSGRIVRVTEEIDSAGMGIRFTNLDEAARRRLSDFTIGAGFQNHE